MHAEPVQVYLLENTIVYNDKSRDWIQFILFSCKFSVYIKVNDLVYSVKPDDTLKARERAIQLVT